LVVIVYSCVEVEPTPQFSKTQTELTVTPSTTTVAVSASDSLDEVISFTWSDPGYSIGLERTKFSIRVSQSGTDFAKFFSKEITGALTGSLLGEEINGMALALGGEVGEPVELDAVVVASHANNNEPIQSAVMKITVTPYAQLVLVPASTEVVTDYENPSDVALELSWNSAFNGLDGVKTYQLQYAEAETEFAEPVTVDVTTFTHSFTHRQLRQIALGYGIEAGVSGPVEFRIKSTNEFGGIEYSNVAVVDVTPYVVPDILYHSIGIVGDATAGGWDIDTDLTRVGGENINLWAGKVYLEGGKNAKFRSSDDWAINWGSTSFPSGTGTQNGDNIPVSTSGYYEIEFDAASGEYSFTPLSTSTYASISLIGAQSGWSSDIADLTQDPDNEHVWTGIVDLDSGELKFRANHDWTTNWGTNGVATSLSGNGVQNAGNMLITLDGTYFVYINTATGAFFFGRPDRAQAYEDVGVVGSATAGGGDSDTNLIRDPSNPYRWSATLNLTAGEAKFRTNNDWAINWGGNTFPAGVGFLNGPNIPVTEEGAYFIVFNSSTGEYTFVK
jgi:hypothetical protein